MRFPVPSPREMHIRIIRNCATCFSGSNPFPRSGICETVGFTQIAPRSAGLRLPIRSPCPAPYSTVHRTVSLHGRALSGSNPFDHYNQKRNGPMPIPFLIGGDGGIRTHVPRRTTAFRVRLVMTTSIRLLSVNVKYFNTFSRQWQQKNAATALRLLFQIVSFLQTALLQLSDHIVGKLFARGSVRKARDHHSLLRLQTLVEN